MATLPDLPTNDAGFVAYHNGLDNGASDIEPTNMLDLSSLGTYQQYDNGVRATYVIVRQDIPDFVLNVRVKTDGWVVVWMDKEEQFYGIDYDWGDISQSKTNSGDFLYNWTYAGIPSDTNYDSAMKDVSQQVFSGIDYSYSVDDVSLYHYNYTDSTATSVVYINASSNADFSYPSTIDRKAEMVNSRGNYNSSSVVFDGSVFATSNVVTTIDMIEEGLTSEPGTNHSVSVDKRSTFVLTGVFSQ